MLENDSFEKSTIVESSATSQNEEEMAYKITGYRFYLVLIGLLLGFFIAAVDQTIVIVALNHIVSEFKAFKDAEWVGSAFMLSTSGFQPVYGMLANRIGHKWTYLLAITIFLIGSVLCGASTSMMMLIISRAVQGMGSAGLITVVLITISTIVPDRERAKYQGYFGVALGLATVAGPLIGGSFADAGLWRWAFYINVVFVLFSIVLIGFFFHDDDTDKKMYKKNWDLRGIDYSSILVLLPGTVCSLVALQLGTMGSEWTSPVVIGLFVTGGLMMGAFVLLQIFVIKNPVFPRRTINRNSVIIYIGQFTSGVSLFALTYYVALHFQVILGYTALMSAVRLFAFYIPAVLAGLVSGILISRTGHYRIYAWLGTIFSATGCALLYTSKVDTNQICLLAFLGISGFGIGLIQQVCVVAGQAAVPAKDIALATSHGQFFRIFGGAIGINVAGCLLKLNTQNAISDLLKSNGFFATVSFEEFGLLSLLPDKLQQQVLNITVSAFDRVYLMTTIMSVIFFIASLGLKHMSAWNFADRRKSINDVLGSFS